MKPAKTICVMAVLLGVCVIGSALAGERVKRGSHDGETVWIEEVKTLNLDAAGIASVAVKTHNGAISYSGNPGGASQVEVMVTVKGGGPNQAAAEAALAAVDLFAESKANGMAEIGWRWRSEKEKEWQAQVSFDIQGPAAIDLDATTHNGAINVQGLVGAVNARSHNGAITVASTGGRLDAEVHNGEIIAEYSGEKLHLQTHNGRIVADLTQCGTVAGDVETHNGEVVIHVSDTTSADVTCTTHSGPIAYEVPLRNMEKSKRKLTGTLGDGGASLTITTHNGKVRIMGPGD